MCKERGDGMPESIYIHIPFCEHICSYCDFCKFFYQKKWVETYLDALEKEILSYDIKHPLKTIYIGGGTPSCLSVDELKQLLTIIDHLPRKLEYEYTMECNIENMTLEKLRLCQQYGINRISYGVQTIHGKHLSYLNRKHTKEQIMEVIQNTKKVGITNINVDLMYAFKDETVTDVEEDIQFILSLDVPHISTYSLIIEPHTQLSIQHETYMDEDLDFEMYAKIVAILKQHGYQHYEVSNFAKPGYQSKHNLVYWNNETYYGVGLSASGYIGHNRYSNTKSFTQYCNGNYVLEEQALDQKIEMENELMLGLRKMEGVSIHHFYEKFHEKIEDVFPIKRLVEEGKLIQQDGYLGIPSEQIYVENNVLVELIGE